MKKVLTVFFLVVMHFDVAVGEGLGRGTMSKARVEVSGSDCRLSNVNIKWNLDSLMGEPTTWGLYKYGDISGCSKLHYSTVLWLQIREKNGPGMGYIKANPVVPDKAEQWAIDTTPTSPNWDEAICGFQGNKKVDCLSKEAAIYLWKNGYISNFYFGAGSRALDDEARENERKRRQSQRGE